MGARNTAAPFPASAPLPGPLPVFPAPGSPCPPLRLVGGGTFPAEGILGGRALPWALIVTAIRMGLPITPTRRRSERSPFFLGAPNGRVWQKTGSSGPGRLYKPIHRGRVRPGSPHGLPINKRRHGERA